MPKVYPTFGDSVYAIHLFRGNILKLNGNFTINAPRQRVWDTLNDVDSLRSIIPGASSLTETAPDEYSASITAGVGPVKGNFQGKVVIRDRDEPRYYRLLIEGRARQGWMKGDGSVELTESTPDTTEVSVQGDFQVGGLIARVGQRMLSGVSNQMMQSFFRDLERIASGK